jgi:hypothetical protein
LSEPLEGELLLKVTDEFEAAFVLGFETHQ